MREECFWKRGRTVRTDDRKTVDVSSVPVRALRADRRRADRTVFVPAWSHARAEKVFLYRRWTVPCGFRSHSCCRRAESVEPDASGAAGYGHQRHSAASYGTEGQNQGRCCHSDDFCCSAGFRLSSDEYLFHLFKSVRRCLQHAVRVDIHPDADQKGRLAVHGAFHCRGHLLHPVLSPDICRNIR